MQNDYNPDESSAEPLVSVGGITAAATAIIGLLVAFGLDLTDEQRTAILGVVAVAAPLAVAAIGRRRVYAPATVAKLLRR
ncbi:hypothetical protein [Micromonospora sp. NPDC047730]|uniref:hypothetical protein n=1 Tax=Micromonospora sp. NPDC047730 TaxID=3364253 RepID=UPI0037122F58